MVAVLVGATVRKVKCEELNKGRTKLAVTVVFYVSWFGIEFGRLSLQCYTTLSFCMVSGIT